MGILATQINFNMTTDFDTLDNEYGELKQNLNYTKQLNLNQNFFDGTDTGWIDNTDCFELINTKEYELNNGGTPLKSQNYDNKDFNIKLNSILTMKEETSGNNISKICFDNIGRPYKTNLNTANILTENIVLTLSTPNGDYNRTITIEKITGYIK
jgi:hypothetical protein